MNEPQAMRMNAKAVLDDRIKRKERDLMAWKTLRDNIEWGLLSEKQEESLWSLFCSTNI